MIYREIFTFGNADCLVMKKVGKLATLDLSTTIDPFLKKPCKNLIGLPGNLKKSNNISNTSNKSTVKLRVRTRLA